MYKCDFFYNNVEGANTNQPYVFACWNVTTDINYSYERTIYDQEFYPNKTIAFIHCLEGECEITTVKGIFTLYQGDCIAFYLNDIISYKSKSTIWEYFWVEFLYDSFPNSNKLYNYQIGNFERELFIELHQAGNNEIKNPFYINAIFYHYLARVLHFRAATDKSNSHLISKKEICNFIEQKYMTALKVEDIARFFNLTPRRINQIFCQNDNISPKKYILTTKINKAKILLRETSVNISEISNMLSFNTPFHFSKIFKQLTGLTPSDFRNKTVSDMQ